QASRTLAGASPSGTEVTSKNRVAPVIDATPSSWSDSRDEVDLDRGVLRQLQHADRRPRVDPRLAEHREEHLRGAVADLALLAETLGALHVDRHAQDALDPVEPTERLAKQGERTHGADRGRLLPVGERDVGADLAGDDDRVAHPRHLPAD